MLLVDVKSDGSLQMDESHEQRACVSLHLAHVQGALEENPEEMKAFVEMKLNDRLIRRQVEKVMFFGWC